MKLFVFLNMNQKIDIKLLLVMPAVIGLGVLFLVNSPSTLQNVSLNPLPIGTIVFGSETFIRQTKTPTMVKRTFAVENFSGPFSILVDNGQLGKNLVSSAIIRLNGLEIFGTNDFNQNIPGISKSIALQQNNTIEVELRSMLNDKIKIIENSNNPLIIVIIQNLIGNR